MSLPGSVGRTPSLSDALRSAVAQGVDRLDAQLLLLHALASPERGRAWLVAHDRDPISHLTEQRFAALVARRQSGEPLAYIVGYQEFFGLRLSVDARVLTPRADTETLVQWALDILPPSAPTLLDLGTGSGAVALALKRQRPDALVSAVDASADALVVARGNAQALQLSVNFFQSDWFDHVPGRFDLLVSNPPYIAQGDAHLAALAHEPQLALTSGSDGLRDLRHLIHQAPDHLSPGGWLLLEHGYDQGHRVHELLCQRGFTQVQSRKDLAGITRCTGACWQSAG